MPLDAILPTIGSVASIGSIPLAVYLFLRTREAKYVRVRREIVRTLSYQIGEGRELPRFEISAVVASKLREANLKLSAINVIEILDDLVSETIANPMLEATRKETIVGNLERLHRIGRSVLEKNLPQEILGAEENAQSAPIQVGTVSAGSEEAQGDREPTAAVNSETEGSSGMPEPTVTLERQTPSSIFGKIATSFTVIAVILVSSGQLSQVLLSREVAAFLTSTDIKFALGAVASLISMLLVGGLVRRAAKQERSET